MMKEVSWEGTEDGRQPWTERVRASCIALSDTALALYEAVVKVACFYF